MMSSLFGSAASIVDVGRRSPVTMVFSLLVATLLGQATAPGAAGQEYRVEVIEEAAPADEVSPAIAALLSDKGYRIVRGTRRTVWEFWPVKVLDVQPDFQPTPERLYPLREGQLVGVVRLRRRWSDFRDQPISRGVYTLRFALQPVDGNHEGTSPTRDFLLLLPASADTDPGAMEKESLYELSAEAAGANHPAIACLQPPATDAAVPSVVHDDVHDWQVAHLGGQQRVSGKTQPMVLAVVVEGQGDE